MNYISGLLFSEFMVRNAAKKQTKNARVDQKCIKVSGAQEIGLENSIGNELKVGISFPIGFPICLL